MEQVKEYTPFGDEWKKECNKLTKDFLIDQWRESLIKLQNLKPETHESLPVKQEIKSDMEIIE